MGGNVVVAMAVVMVVMLVEYTLIEDKRLMIELDLVSGFWAVLFLGIDAPSDSRSRNWMVTSKTRYRGDILMQR